MDLTEQERELLAARLIREMETRFRGVAQRAYTAAGVNSATWKRATAAQSIKPHTRIAIVGNLWPETGGDWQQIPEPQLVDPERVALAELQAEVADLRRGLDEAREEIRALRGDGPPRSA